MTFARGLDSETVSGWFG